jgi:PTS system galactitol-specific IIB component
MIRNNAKLSNDNKQKGAKLMAKKVLVATGSSVNKMKFAVQTIQDMCAGKGVEVEVTGVNIYEADIAKEDPDVIVFMGPANFKTTKPLISGMAFITKMGIEKTIDEIIEKLK